MDPEKIHPLAIKHDDIELDDFPICMPTHREAPIHVHAPTARQLRTPPAPANPATALMIPWLFRPA